MLLSLSMLALSAGFTWAVTDDYAARDVVPAGVHIGAVELGGLTAAQAQAVIERQVAAPLLEPVTVTTPDGDTQLPADDMLSVDIAGMVDSAIQPKREISLPERVYLRLSGETIETEVDTLLAVDEAKLTEWVATAAKKLDRAAVDSTLTIGEGTITVVPDKPGYRTRTEEAATQLDEALTSGVKTAVLPADELTATVSANSWGKMILVDISQRRLWLYNNSVVEKTYRVAVGTGGYPTPKGNFKIINKRYRPSWSNPAPNGWGAGMPAYIPPGAGNPLGTRALDLNAPGIRIHGTNKRSSIGRAASHGCMRMLREDIEQLYDLVPVGTPVYIVR